MPNSRDIANAVNTLFGQPEPTTAPRPTRARRPRQTAQVVQEQVVEQPTRRLEVTDGIAESERRLLEEAFMLSELRKQEKLMENAIQLVKQKIRTIESNMRTTRTA